MYRYFVARRSTDFLLKQQQYKNKTAKARRHKHKMIENEMFTVQIKNETKKNYKKINTYLIRHRRNLVIDNNNY